MRPALVFSVPGSGSRFTVALLEARGYRPGVDLQQIHSWVDHGKHVEDMKRLLAARDAGYKAVVPLRSPVATFLTRRRVAAGETQAEKDRVSKERTLTYWGTLIGWLPRLDHVLFPVEDERVPRSERIARVERHLGLDPSDDLPPWERVGSRSGDDEDLEVDVSFLDQMTRLYDWLLEDYAR